LSLSVERGSFTALLGPSGCGKSTLLRMIAGLEEITIGQCFIDNVDVTDVPPAQRRIAMVFQSYALYPHMTVRQNIAFSLSIAGQPKKVQNERALEVARILQLEPYLDRRPAELSGGQRQRVAIGRALVRKPEVFLFDEPLSNLDAMLRVQMRVEIKRIHDRLGTTAIYVTHDQVEAMTLGDRVVVMKDGIVQQVGDPLELYNAPTNRFVAGFIGSPAMNFAKVGVAEEGGTICAVGDGMRLKLPPRIAERLRAHVGDEVTLGIRPEDLYLTSGDSADGLSFAAVVEVVERLGSQILLDVKVGSGAMVAAVEPTVQAKVREHLRLRLNAERLHFFDGRSEIAI
jgi:multiple sugar transport system ATP-binding protein